MTAPDAPDSMPFLTDLHREFTSTAHHTDGADNADAAVQAAEVAARAAGVRVREISEISELDAVYRLYAAIWRPDPKHPPVTTELLRALSKAGNYVAAAFDGDELVGACVGFFAAPAHEALHSHIAGVSAAAQGRSVGFALKTHQRAWALLHGVPAIAWTYDPLVRRNAHFNLAKLAAQPAEYLNNFYGGMHDAINGGDDTDRLLVHWDLDSPAVRAACTGATRTVDARAERRAGAAVALDVAGHGGPVAGRLDARTLLVAVPTDIEALRRGDPGVGKDWRVAVREVLGTLMADGARVTGFDRAGWYVLTRTDPTSEENR
jgi:predicted GNAT superfamily acetyltransferase